METIYTNILPLVANGMIRLVVFAIVFDTIFGVGRAIRERKLNSCIGIDGALRKFGMVVAVTGFAILDKMVNFNLVPFLPKEALSFFGLERVGTCEFFCVLFICYEAVSILKNMYLCGLPVYGIWKHVRDFLGNYTDELPDDDEVKEAKKEVMYGIDICSYQGKPDWAKVKKAGCDFAVLKCIRKDLSPDTSFAYNVHGCAAQKIPVSVYTYVYENTEEGAVKRARASIKACKALGVENCIIWWDVEERSVFKTGVNARAKTTASILAAKKVILEAGYGFGVYCDADFYTGYLNADHIGGKWWIASYGHNRVTTFGQKPDRKKPTIKNELCGWQYCSRGRVPGISGSVDLDVAFDDDFVKVVTTVDPLPTHEMTVTNKKGANLRELPSGESKTVETVKKGEALDVLNHVTATNTVGEATEYVCVKRGGKWLWCASKLLG